MSNPKTPITELSSEPKPRQTKNDLAIAKSKEETIQKEMGINDAKREKEAKQKKAKDDRIKNSKKVRDAFKDLDFTIYEDEKSIYAASIMFGLLIFLSSALFLISLNDSRALPVLGGIGAALAALATVVTIRSSLESNSKKAVFMIAVTIYCALMVTLATLQLWGILLPVFIYCFLAIYIVSICLETLVLVATARFSRRRRLNPRPLYRYRFMAWIDSTDDDKRPDANAMKKIKYDSQLMRIQIQHFDYPIRVTTTVACAEVVTQILAQGVVCGNVDLEACANAAVGALRRISTINVDKTRIVENGLEYNRALHIAKALLKSSLQRGIMREPVLGF